MQERKGDVMWLFKRKEHEVRQWTEPKVFAPDGIHCDENGLYRKIYVNVDTFEQAVKLAFEEANKIPRYDCGGVTYVLNPAPVKVGFGFDGVLLYPYRWNVIFKWEVKGDI
jgi:hypothetical protein